MNAAPAEPDEPPPAPATGSRTGSDWIYPEPPDPTHNGPEPCDAPTIYRVETVK